MPGLFHFGRDREMQDRYTLREAAAVLGVDYEKLKSDARRGKFTVITDDDKKKTRYITPETLLSLKHGATPDRYHDLVEQYLAELTAGTIGKRPATQRYRDDMEYYLQRFWQETKLKASIHAINPETMRAAYTAIGFDDGNKKDYHAVKIKIHRAVSGFSRLLVREGHKTKDQHADIIGTKPPGKKYQNDKTIITPASLNEIIETNRAWVRGRRISDMKAGDLLIHLYAYTGIRRMEAANLMLGDVDLKEGSLRVWGKGGKRRKIPIWHKVAVVLEEWLKTYRPRSPRRNLLVNHDGLPFNENSLNDKFCRLSKVCKRKVKPHLLRHACATILSNEGMPVALIQRLLGHSNILVTQLYLDTTDADLFAWAARQKPIVAEPAPVKQDAGSWD